MISVAALPRRLVSEDVQLAPLFALLLTFVSVAVAADPDVTSPDDLCAPQDDPCTVTRDRRVADMGALGELNFGQRHLVIKQGKKLELAVKNGAMRFRAGRVTVEQGGALVAESGRIVVTTTGAITVHRAANSSGRIDVSGAPGGSIDLVTLNGDVLVQGRLELSGKDNASEESGGSLVIQGRDVTLTGEIDLHGGRADIAAAGDATISADRDLVLSGTIDATANDGGEVSLDALGALSMTGLIDTSGSGDGGQAGGVVLGARTELAVGGTLRMRGNDGSDDIGGGFGGDLFLSAGSVTLSGSIDVSAGTPEGQGGGFEILADGDVAFAPGAAVDGEARGSSGIGGDAGMTVGGTLVLGSIAVTGRAEGGGIDAVATCGIAVPAGVVLDVRGGPESGTIGLTSGGPVEVAGTVFGGLFTRITVRDDADFSQPPGGAVQPAPTIVEDPAQPRCGGAPPACGNGTIDAEAGEVCDDGNTADCDTCAADCSGPPTIVCGNGTRECDEVCDDANQVGCDGCAADCRSREPVCGNGVRECDEQADEGAAIACDADGVSATCTLEACGNGVLECAEECDDGAAGSPTCTPGTCVRRGCGDGVVSEGEECEGVAPPASCDGDGCSATCQNEGPGNDILECAEECEDGNTDACDGCDATGKVERCGDGVLDCGEGCDAGDANGTLASGCTDECQDASVCLLGGPRPCLPCGTARDCNPAGVCSGTRCQGGVCVPGPPPTCPSDGNACTTEACDPGVQSCVPTPISCDDGDACTLDSCDPARGCAHAPACEDGDPCTDDSCSAGACTSVPRRCDDGNACTIDRCGANGCTTAPRPCDDADPCTDDACDSATGCTATAVVCDDGDECTDDACNALAGGCVAPVRAGTPGVRCLLGGFRTVVQSAGDAQVPAKVRRSLLRALGRVLKAADTVDRADSEKARAKQRRRLDKLVAALNAATTRACARSVEAATCDALRGRLGGVAAALGG